MLDWLASRGAGQPFADAAAELEGAVDAAFAAGLGAASSSCSYAASALAKTLFARGADFTAAQAFMFASTNLVLELGIVLWLLLGWPFAADRRRQRATEGHR